MNLYEFDAEVESVLHTLRNLLTEKHKHYGGRPILSTGFEGIALKVEMKTARLTNLAAEARQPDLSEETKYSLNQAVIDTVMDIAGYGVLGVMLAQGTLKR